MKKPSRRTIVNRIKRGDNICPVCGCRKTIYIHHNVGYPEVWDEDYCKRCGQAVGIADNSPYCHICDDIREAKFISYKICLRIAKQWDKHMEIGRASCRERVYVQV